MVIFIDTNILINENYLKSTRFSVFLRAVRFLGYRVIIPEVVIDELLNRFQRNVSKETVSYSKSNRQLRKLISTLL